MRQVKHCDARLTVVGGFVRPGAVLADVGTDHAWLPITLLREGKITSAIASDIHKGPIANANANIAAAGLTDRIRTICCDGVAPLAAYSPTDIVIAGMGGMLICEILAAAPFVRDSRIRLILQPMRDADAVRRYLVGAGFAILDEALSADDEKLYEVIVAEYTGAPTTLSPLAALLGPCIMKHADAPLLQQKLAKLRRTLHVRVTALAAANKPDASLAALLAELEDFCAAHCKTGD